MIAAAFIGYMAIGALVIFGAWKAIDYFTKKGTRRGK